MSHLDGDAHTVKHEQQQKITGGMALAIDKGSIVTLVFLLFVCICVCFYRHGPLEREALAAAVPSFLYTCQPYFNYLESTSIVSQRSPVHFDIYTRV